MTTMTARVCESLRAIVAEAPAKLVAIQYGPEILHILAGNNPVVFVALPVALVAAGPVSPVAAPFPADAAAVVLCVP